LESASGLGEKFHIRNEVRATLVIVPASLEKQLGRFLREKRGTQTFVQFSKKTGFPPSTLHRLEQGTQSITLRGLQQIMRRLKCRLPDIFDDC
jgi:predicted transcriptional regulator